MSASNDRDYLTVDEAADALARAGGELTHIVDTIESYTAELVAAARKDGEDGFRTVLDRMSREIMERVEEATANFDVKPEAGPFAEFPGRQ